MLSKNDRERLHHILDSMEKLDTALFGYTFAQFVEDWQKQLVIERLLEIIGEASAHLSPELREQYFNIPWAKMVGMRNVVSHQYFRIDLTSIWYTAVEAVPPLHVEIQHILEQEP
ncbi:MAG: DUF86 domain-containing protein [Chloroflexi bacterium]|nr:DUF86 domain-containing protein [Chloroflexota bacterium]